MGVMDGKVAMAAAGARVVVDDLGGTLGGDATAENPARQVADEIAAAGGEAVANTASPTCWSPPCGRISTT